MSTTDNGCMSSDLARVGRAIGTPARAAMVVLLFDGTSHTAGELALAAGVASGTASEHLAILVDAGVVSVQQDGRHRRYRLANRRIAHALEQLAAPEPAPITSLRLSSEQRRVRLARTCYDHLAGQLGVGLADRFVVAGWVDASMSTVTESGVEALHSRFGIDPDQLGRTGSRRPVVRACRDWTEQRDHLAGRIGAVLADAALTQGWVTRKSGSRALTVTPAGREVLRRAEVSLSPG